MRLTGWIHIDVQHPLFMDQEDASGLLDGCATKPVDLRLELLADFFKGFGIEGAAQSVVKEGYEGAGIFVSMEPGFFCGLFMCG